MWVKMETNALNLFFLGKGGVGKSTSSALQAVTLAKQGYKVLLASMDPAHNQADIFERPLFEEPTRLSDQLLVKEVDINLWVKKYLNNVERQISTSYNYLTALNLQDYIKVIKYSPGIEEYALLLAFNAIEEAYNQKLDYIIFDMPPTALTLKFFGLPWLSLIWLEKLLELRREILKRREIITRVQLGKKEIETDKILNKINNQIEDYKRIKKIFSNTDQTHIYLVMNPDKLSLSESILISNRLKEYDLTLKQIFLNKYNGEDTGHIEKELPGLTITKLPFSSRPIIGLKNIEAFLAEMNSENNGQL